MTHQEYLNKMLEHLKQENPEFDETLTISFKPFTGWQLCGEPRWFTDNGCDTIGKDCAEAIKYLSWLFKSTDGGS